MVCDAREMKIFVFDFDIFLTAHRQSSASRDSASITRFSLLSRSQRVENFLLLTTFLLAFARSHMTMTLENTTALRWKKCKRQRLADHSREDVFDVHRKEDSKKFAHAANAFTCDKISSKNMKIMCESDETSSHERERRQTKSPSLELLSGELIAPCLS